ncbi:MAG: S8 family serine peptidase [Terriglobales bacterium]
MPVVSHRALFAFRSAPSQTEVAAIQSLTAASDIGPVGGAGAYAVDSPTMDVGALMAVLANRSDVVNVEPDMVFQVDATPNDPDYSQQWGLQRISAPTAWNTTTGSRSTVVAEIDTGVQYDHPDLAANMWSAPTAFTLTVGDNTFNCPAGDHGFGILILQSPGVFSCDPGDYEDTSQYDLDHGTAVAGVIGAVGNNAIGIAGVNWGVSIVPVKACALEGEGVNDVPTPSCDEIDVITALETIIQLKAHFGAQANVVAVNMSFSGVNGNAANLETEIARAQTYGIMVAAATGNECNSGADPPASFGLPNEVAVAASDQNDYPSSWPNGQCSNGGGQTAAPGTSIYSTSTNNGYTGGFAGTSAATAFVTGAAALVYSACTLPPHALAEDLVNSSDYAPSLASVSYGRRLDFAAAVQRCTTGTPGTGQIYISGSECEGCYNYPEVPSSGTITVTVAFSQYYFYWDADGGSTAIDTANAIASDINSDPFGVVTASASGGAGSAVVNITSKAKGPATGYFGISVTNTDSCTPPYGGSCAPDPFSISSSYSGGAS